MENANDNKEFRNRFRIGGNSRNSSVVIGTVIVVAGFLILLSSMGLPVPHWMLSWQMLLIGIGILLGVKSGFKDTSWIFPIIIGLIFISDEVFPDLRFRNLLWPIGVMVIGFVILTRGSKRRLNNDSFSNEAQSNNDWFNTGFKRIDDPNDNPGVASSSSIAASIDDKIECTAVFGGVKRTVVSKNFKGGEIVAIFGGADVDLTHADINGVVKLEATCILGGTKLIVPPHWDVQSEMVAILGGVEDKRRIQPELIDRSKRLILVGTAFLGGLEIKSY